MTDFAIGLPVSFEAAILLQAEGTQLRFRMVITVVIPTYNRRQSLAYCLESLFRQTYPCDHFEIIVVVDGSTDDSREYLRQLKFPCASQVIEQRNEGQASARNAGIRAANGKYILLLDDDFVCDASLIEEHIKWHSSEGIVVVGPILRDLGDQSLPAIAVDREIRPFYEHRITGTRPSAWLPPNSSLERDVLLACGGYDEEFASAREDTELGMRLADHGTNLHYAPEAVVHQRYGKSASALVADAALFGKNDVRLLRKRPDYLAFCNLSQVDQGSLWKRLGRRLVSAVPFSMEPLVALPYLLLAGFNDKGRLREVGIRLLNLRRYIVWLRSAVSEAGSWNRLTALIEGARKTTGGYTG
jgi:GT2 family glycosyltransferase